MVVATTTYNRSYNHPAQPRPVLKTTGLRQKERSLGTSAVQANQQAEKQRMWESSDSSDDERYYGARGIARGPLPPAGARTRRSWYPPPSPPPPLPSQPLPPLQTTANIRKEPVIVLDDGMHEAQHARAAPVAVMPPMPPTPDPAGPSPKSPYLMPPPEPTDQSVTVARTKSRRRTIKEMIEGWWDLGLLDAQKRQTMLANKRQSAALEKR